MNTFRLFERGPAQQGVFAYFTSACRAERMMTSRTERLRQNLGPVDMARPPAAPQSQSSATGDDVRILVVR